MDNRGALENLEQSEMTSSRKNLRGRFPGRTSSEGSWSTGEHVWNLSVPSRSTSNSPAISALDLMERISEQRAKPSDVGRTKS